MKKDKTKTLLEKELQKSSQNKIVFGEKNPISDYLLNPTTEGEFTPSEKFEEVFKRGKLDATDSELDEK